MVEIQEAAPQPPQVSNPAQRSALIGAGIYLAFYTAMVLFNTFPPKLPPVAWALLAPITTVAYLLLLTYTLMLFCRLTLRVGSETLLMLISLLLFLALNPMVRDIAWKLLTGHNWNDILSHITMTQSDVKSPVDMALKILVPFLLILTGAFFGQIIARLIRERALLVPVAIIAGLVDFWGVYWGFVNHVSKAAPAAISGMATAATESVRIPTDVHLPAQLAVFGNINPPQNIGIGDFVFLALFLTCAYRLGFSPKRTMWGIFAGLLIASILIAMNGSTVFGLPIQFDYLPGLVFISGGVLLANIGYWQLSRNEWLMTAALSAVFLVFIGRSVYEAEKTKPHIADTRFMLTAASGLDAVTQVRTRLTKELKPGTELLPVEVVCFYMKGAAGEVTMKGWMGEMIERRPHAPLYQLHDYVIVAANTGKNAAWKVDMQAHRPPSDFVLSMLPSDRKGEQDPLQLLEKSHGIPEDAFALLDVKNNLPQYASLPAMFQLRLRPSSGLIITKKGIIPLSYAKQK